MKKTMFLFTMFFFIAYSFVAGKSQMSIWQSMDGKDYLGGDCYLFTVSKCTGLTYDCSSVTCSSSNGGQSWSCNNTSYQKKVGSTYASACPPTESGGWPDCSPNPIPYTCSVLETCATTCSQNITNGYWYCNLKASVYTPSTVTEYSTSDPDASCQ